MYRSSFTPATTILTCALLVLGACSDSTPTSPASAPNLSRASSVDGPARIAICPTSESYRTRGIIGPDGGTLAIAGHRVTVPPGVLTRNTRFTLYAPAGRAVKIELTAGQGKHYEFAAPVTVTISYDRCERQHRGAAASAWYLDDSGGAVQLERMGGQDDRAERTVTFQTNHFSTYVVAY